MNRDLKELKNKVKEFILSKEFVWTYEIVKHFKLENDNSSWDRIKVDVINKLQRENKLQPCDRKGNSTQYIIIN